VVINKKIALALVVTNIIFLGYSIFVFFYFHHTVFQYIGQPGPTGPSPDSVWILSISFLDVALYIGLYWVLGVFREHLLIKGAMFILLLLKIQAQFSLNWNSLESLAMRSFFQSIIVFFFYAFVALTLVLLFVHNKLIRGYFRSFVVMMVVAWILPYIGTYAYDNLNIHWLWIDRFFLDWLTFIPTLLIFLKVYRLSKQSPLSIQE
jgi:hypothetical protein